MSESTVTTTRTDAAPTRTERPTRGTVAVVILTWNGRDDTLACLESLCPALGAEDRVYVVDNGSEDGTEDAVRSAFPQLHFVQNGANLGFAAGNNVGIDLALAADADWVFILNNDTVLAPSDLDSLVVAAEAEHARDRSRTVFQPALVRADAPDQIDSCGHRIHRSPGASDLYSGAPVSVLPDQPTEIFGACGAATLVRREALAPCDGFDPALFVLFEDVDLAFRLRAHGNRAFLIPAVRIHHKRGVSAARRDDVAARKRSFWIQRNTVALALQWWPLLTLLATSPLLAWRICNALWLDARHGLGDCSELWSRALGERGTSRALARRHGIDRWIGAPRSAE